LIEAYLATGGFVASLRLQAGRTVVVVPHPDDEALSTGGLVAHQRARGRDVVVVSVTDGDAAYPDWPGVELARVRRREQLHALRLLGVGRDSFERLALPDGRVGDHEGELAQVLADLVGPDDVVVAPARFDWHPDHEACARAAVAAAHIRGCRVLGSLFWAHHRPEHAAGRPFSLAALMLDAEETERRRAAVAAHRSQLLSSERTTDTPIVAPDLLGHLDLPVEYYVIDD
jgi:LmbE family N-acetylglucosaminyl deacetylase